MAMTITITDRVSFWFLFVFVFSLLALLPTEISADQSEGKEFVLTLDHYNFSDIVSKQNFIAVEFYAPLCGHCLRRAPEYEKAASILSSHDPPVVLAKVDAMKKTTENLQLSLRLGYSQQLRF